MAYATIGDIFSKALRAEAFIARPRAVASADPIANVIALPSHGFTAGLLPALTFVLMGNATPGAFGMPSGVPTLPVGLSVSTRYYPLPLGGDLFQVAASPSGPPVALLSAGAPLFGVLVDTTATLAALLDSTAAFPLDEALTNYDPPIIRDPMTGLFPEVIVTVNALLAARAALPVFGLAHPQYEKSLDAMLVGWQANVTSAMERWVKGKPINVRPQDQTSGYLESAARASSDRPPQGWTRNTL